MSLGPNAELIKNTLPQGVDGIVKYAIEATKRVAEMRRGLIVTPEMQKKIIDLMEQQHQIYQLVG